MKHHVCPLEMHLPHIPVAEHVGLGNRNPWSADAGIVDEDIKPAFLFYLFNRERNLILVCDIECEFADFYVGVDGVDCLLDLV